MMLCSVKAFPPKRSSGLPNCFIHYSLKVAPISVSGMIYRYLLKSIVKIWYSRSPFRVEPLHTKMFCFMYQRYEHQPIAPISVSGETLTFFRHLFIPNKHISQLILQCRIFLNGGMKKTNGILLR